MASEPTSVRRRFTTTADGDFFIDRPLDELAPARAAVAPGSWTWLRQVHGDRVVVVDAPGRHAGDEADGAVTQVAGAVLAVHTADCVPVLLSDEETGVIGAAHAGWKGLEAEVVQHTVAAMKSLGAVDIDASVGPCICPRCYQFGQADLTRLALRYGPDVVGATDAGDPALDLRAAIRAALGEAGIEDGRVVVDARCTATASTASGDHSFFSWRARGDRGRQASLVWMEPRGDD